MSERKISREGRKGLRRGGKNGSREDKSKAGKIGIRKMAEKLLQTPAPTPATPEPKPTPAPVPHPLIKVLIEDRQVEVPRKTYVTAKTKQLQEFGYTTLTENTVNEQLDAILAGKPTSVIGEFMRDEIVLPGKPS